MRSILFWIKTILRNQIGRNYLKKKKAFSEFFFAFSKSALNLQHFQKKRDPHTWFISDITNSGKRG